MSFFQTRRLWNRGPVLAFDLYVIAYRVPGTDIVHRVRVRMEVTNVGRMAATVRSAEVQGPWSPSLTETDITQGSFPILHDHHLSGRTLARSQSSEVASWLGRLIRR